MEGKKSYAQANKSTCRLILSSQVSNTKGETREEEEKGGETGKMREREESDAFGLRVNGR